MIVTNITKSDLRKRRAKKNLTDLNTVELKEEEDLDYIRDFELVDLKLEGEDLEYEPLNKQILQLPKKLQLVIAKHYFEDKPLAEIAAEENVKVNTVHQRHFQALKRLKGAMNPKNPSDDP